MLLNYIVHIFLIIFIKRPVFGIKIKQVFSYAVDGLCATNASEKRRRYLKDNDFGNYAGNRN